MRRISLVGNALGFTLAIAFTASTHAQPPLRDFKLPKAVDDILWWLPEDTETLMVTQGPFAVGAESRAIDVDALGLDATAQLITLSIGDDHFDPELAKTLRKRPIALAVHGSRRFRAPNGFGMMRYEGALIHSRLSLRESASPLHTSHSRRFPPDLPRAKRSGSLTCSINE